MNCLRRQPHRRTKPHWLLLFALAGLGWWLDTSELRGGPLDQWTAAATPPTTLPLYAVAAGADRIVAVGELGVVASSADLSAWTVSQHGPNLFAVACGKQGFFAVGESGSGLASADGVNWALRYSGTSSADARGIAWGNGGFVAVSDSGLVANITDPVYWNWFATGFGPALHAVTWTPSGFVAVGSYGTILTSRNGANWTNRTPLAYENMQGVAYGGGAYVAVGDFGGVLASVDGKSWTILDAGIQDSPLAIAYGGGTFAAAGRLGAIWTSPDGVRWTPRDSGTSLDLHGIAYFHSRFVAVGDSGTILVSGELPLVKLAAEETRILESERDVPPQLRISRGGSVTGDLTVPLAISGTAVNGADYEAVSDILVIPAGQTSATIAITPIEDNLPEDIETVTVAILETDTYGFEPPVSATLSIGEALVTIEAVDPQAGEAGLDPGAVRVRRQGRVDTPLEVRFDTSGTAKAGADYETLGLTVIIPGGESGALIPVTPLDDSQSEGKETVVVTLRPGGHYLAGVPDQASVDLLDDEPPLLMDWDVWQWRHPKPAGASFDKVVFGNGLFVALNGGGGIFTSTDGREWAARNPSLGLTMVDIAFGHGRFVIVGYENASAGERILLSSTDGQRWIPKKHAGNSGTLLKLFHAQDLFFGLTEENMMLTSPDGALWTQTPDQLTGSLAALAYGNGRYVALSYDGSPGNPLWTSIDGAHWSVATNVAGRYLFTAGFGHGRFLATGRDGLTLVSPDGLAWDLAHNGPDGDDLTSLASGAGLFTAISPSGIWTSPDGSDWTPRGESNLGWQPSSVVYGNGIFLVTGVEFLSIFDIDRGWPHVMTSPDGETWTPLDSGSRHALRSIAFDSERLVAVGDGIILASTNRVDWMEATNDPALFLRGVAHGNGRFVAVGNQILASTDGSVWTALAEDKSLNSVVWGQNRFLAVGDYGVVETSPDGMNWTQQEPITDGSLRGVAFGNGQFVAVSASWPYEILASTNGTQWSVQAQNLNVPLTDATYAAGLFVAGGNLFGACCGSGSIFSSADGAGWVPRADGLYINGVAGSHAGAFAAVGGFSSFFGHGFRFRVQNLATSDDGVRWTQRHHPPMPGWLNDLVWAESCFIAVGEDGAILESLAIPPQVQPRFIPGGLSFPPGGGTRLHLQAPAGSVVILEASPELQQWTFVDGAESLDGTVRIDDPDGGLEARRFYRARAPVP